MRINNNLTGSHVNRLYTVNTRHMEKSIEKLTLGRRINRAVDDASGLAISEKLRSEIRGLRQGVRNAQDGISLVQTVEGALSETQNILHRMRELAVQSSHDTYAPEDRTEIQNELERLIDEISRIATATKFNTMTTLDGSRESKGLMIALGSQGSKGINLAIYNMQSSALNLQATAEELGQLEVFNAIGYLDIQSAEKANQAIGIIDEATKLVGSERTNLGAVQNQLESAIANLSVSIENLQASESGYRDLDLPHEVMSLAKHQILSSSINMVLAHANVNPTSIVPLLL